VPNMAEGEYLLRLINSNGPIDNLVVGGNISSLVGCAHISNALDIRVTFIEGGVLSAPPLVFCTGDGEDDFIPEGAISLTGASGRFGQWVITDETGTEILGLPDDPYAINFNEVSEGTCDLWYVSADDPIDYLEIGDDFRTSLPVCSASSNFIPITRFNNTVPVIEGGPLEFCIPSDDAMFITEDDVTVSNLNSVNQRWLLTDSENNIVLAQTSLSSFEVLVSQTGTYFLYLVGHEQSLENGIAGFNLSDMEGCYEVSNSITVEIIDCPISAIVGGSLSGTSTSYCLDDTPDYLQNVEYVDGTGFLNRWIILDEFDNILALPNNVDNYDLERLGEGIYRVHRMTYEPGIVGVSVTNNLVDDVEGDYALSNYITVTNLFCGSAIVGGDLMGASYEGCGYDVMTYVDGLSLLGQTGENNFWVITDMDYTILYLSSQTSPLDYRALGSGIFFVYNISYNGGITGLENGNNLIEDLEGDYALSNNLAFSITNVTAPTANSAYQYLYCSDSDENISIDPEEVELQEGEGNYIHWLLVDNQRFILQVQEEINNLDLSELANGNYQAYWLATTEIINSDYLGTQLDNLSLCNELSAPVSIAVDACEPAPRISGGNISGGPFHYCLEDNSEDVIAQEDVTLVDAEGASKWIITDESGYIVDVADSYMDFKFYNFNLANLDLWHLAYEGTLQGLEIDGLISEVDGEFSLSNSIAIEKSNCATIVITEFNTDNKVEIKNVSGRPMNVAGYILSQYPDNVAIGTLDILCGDGYLLDTSEVITVRANFDISSESGELALFKDYNFEMPGVIKDYVQWGEDEHYNAEMAVKSFIWKDSMMVASFPADMSMMHDGNGDLNTDWYFAESTFCDERGVLPTRPTYSVSVGPNPTTDRLSISSYGKYADEITTVLISNSTGEIMGRHKFIGNNFIIDVSQYPTGMYYVRVSRARYEEVQAIMIVD